MNNPVFTSCKSDFGSLRVFLDYVKARAKTAIEAHAITINHGVYDSSLFAKGGGFVFQIYRERIPLWSHSAALPLLDGGGFFTAR